MVIIVNRVKSIKVDDSTHRHLQRLGKKGDSFNDIIMRLVEHELINEMLPTFDIIQDECRSKLYLGKNPDRDAEEPVEIMTFDELVSETRRVFEKIDFDYGVRPDWKLEHCLEIATDEDFVGDVAFGDRDLPLSEVIINAYCLYLDMPSPTTGLAMRSPFVNAFK